MGKVVLRYFEAQGRVQALRHTLADAGVAYEDERVALGDWSTLKPDRSLTGPFGSLPLLVYEGVTVVEALPIASFLGRRLGHTASLDEAAAYQLEAVSSCCYLDIILRAGEILHAEALYPGVDLAAMIPRAVGHAVHKLTRVDELLPNGGWLGRDRPTVADFFVAESVFVLRYMLGPARDAELRRRAPRAFDLAERVRERPSLRGEWTRRPAQLTASPLEPKAVGVLHAIDLTSGGL